MVAGEKSALGTDQHVNGIFLYFLLACCLESWRSIKEVLEEEERKTISRFWCWWVSQQLQEYTKMWTVTSYTALIGLLFLLEAEVDKGNVGGRGEENKK